LGEFKRTALDEGKKTNREREGLRRKQIPIPGGSLARVEDYPWLTTKQIASEGEVSLSIKRGLPSKKKKERSQTRGEKSEIARATISGYYCIAKAGDHIRSNQGERGAWGGVLALKRRRVRETVKGIPVRLSKGHERKTLKGRQE